MERVKSVEETWTLTDARAYKADVRESFLYGTVDAPHACLIKRRVLALPEEAELSAISGRHHNTIGLHSVRLIRTVLRDIERAVLVCVGGPRLHLDYLVAGVLDGNIDKECPDGVPEALAMLGGHVWHSFVRFHDKDWRY